MIGQLKKRNKICISTFPNLTLFLMLLLGFVRGEMDSLTCMKPRMGKF